MAKNETYIEPEVHFLTFSDYGQPVVTRFLPSQQRLADIDLSFLQYVMKRWKKRNRRLRREDEHNLVSTKLIFPLEIDRLYDGKTTLCRVDGEGKLSPIDKWLIKRAFIFSTPKIGDESNAQNIESSIKILNETVIKAIRSLSKDQFDAAYREYKNFHLLLLELGETKSNGKNINYGVIEGSWFGGSLYKGWAHSYRNIYDESVAVLSQQDDFFRTSSYTAHYLMDSIFFMPSMTGLDSVIEFQGYLWFRLNEWWREQVEKQGSKEHHNAAPVLLLPPEAKTYEDAVRHFVGAWEATQRIIISKADKHTHTWEDYRIVFKAFDSHLTEIISFVARAILSGNRYAAKQATEMLMRWYGHISISLHESTSDYWLTHGVKAIRATPHLFEQPWNQVEQILADENAFHKSSEKSVLKAILLTYWQDVSALLTGFLINWSLSAAPTNPDHAPLSLEILDKLLKGSLDDDADSHSRSAFAKNLKDFLIIFLRQNMRHHWAKGSYQADLSEICRRVDGLTEPARVSGRIYMGHGDPIDSIKTPLIILAMLLAGENEADILSQNTKESISLLLEDDQTAKNLEYALKKNIESVDTIDLAAVARVFGGLLPKEKATPNVTNDNVTTEIGDIETTTTEPTTARYERRREQVKQLFASLQQLIRDHRTKKVQVLPVSDAKLMKIVEDASSEAFDKKTAKFPVNLFKEVEFTTEALPARKLTDSNYPKGMLTEPVMDEVHFGERWHSELIAPHVYGHLIFSIVDKARSNQQIENATATTQQQYADLLMEKAALLKEAGLTPIIIVETFQTPRWIRGWESARWDKRIQLPSNIAIERIEKRKRGGYLFHVNDVPVYEAKALIQGTLVMAEETFQKVCFRQFDNGYPVDVTYQIDPNDPWQGTLMYEWQRDVVLGNERVFFITYPQLAPEE